MLKSDKPEARAGACAALGYQGEKAAAAVPLIAKALEDEAIVAISASYALARINKPAREALPQLLKAVLATEEDGLMRPVQQAMAFSLGYAPGRVAPLYFDGLLPGLAADGNPLDGLDRGLLYPAIGKLLQDPGGRTRGCAAYALTHFTREDLAAMAQQVYDAVKSPAQHYLMFDDQARQYALDLMLKHRIAEGIPLCLESMDIDRWGRGTRLEHRFATLKGYGGSAKAALPGLLALREPLKKDAALPLLEEAIRAIEQGGQSAPLVSLHTLVDERLARDLAVVEDDQLQARACRELMGQQSGRCLLSGRLPPPDRCDPRAGRLRRRRRGARGRERDPAPGRHHAGWRAAAQGSRPAVVGATHPIRRRQTGGHPRGPGEMIRLSPEWCGHKRDFVGFTGETPALLEQSARLCPRHSAQSGILPASTGPARPEQSAPFHRKDGSPERPKRGGFAGPSTRRPGGRRRALRASRSPPRWQVGRSPGSLRIGADAGLAGRRRRGSPQPRGLPRRREPRKTCLPGRRRSTFQPARLHRE